MSSDNRSIKRRRVTSEHDSTQLPRSAGKAESSRKHDIPGSESATQNVGNDSLDENGHGGNRTPSRTTKASKPHHAASHSSVTNNEDESERSSGAESGEEPRRSGRQRKPSAKLLSQKNDVSRTSTPSKPRPSPLPRPKKPVGNDVAQSPLSTPATSVKKPKSTKSTPSQTTKTKNRPPKNNVPTQPADIKNTTPPPAEPIHTPKKRGRPPGSHKKPVDAVAPVETPKVIRFDLPTKEVNSAAHEIQQTDVDVEEEVSPQDQDALKEQQAIIDKALPKFEGCEFPLAAISKPILEKLAQRRPTPLTHLQDEYGKVYTLLESTVTAGEGNSMVIVGARGSGKSTLVNKALAELSKTQKEHFHVVRLNGFIQTDDKLALREIWRQLGREMEIDEDASKSYADTLTMLLALLSHPDEIAGETVDQVAKSVIIIMDEFDLFATHARQTLLYNLLDIAQSRKAPIAVLGLTTKFDVTERLEKRVKSRFSHRYVHLPLAKSLRAFQDICKAAVTLQPDELSFEDQISLTQTVLSVAKQKVGSSFLVDTLAIWNASVNMLFLNDDFCRAYLMDAFHLTKSVPAVLTSLLLPISSLARVAMQPLMSLLPVEHFVAYQPHQNLQAPYSTLLLVLPSLSELQLSLLIAAARLDIIHDTDTCSFGMAYAHYVELASKARLHSAAAGALATGAGARVWGRDVARGEWEVLLKKNLLLPISEASGVATAAVSGSLVKVDVRLEEISGAVKGLSSVMERWCKQI